LGAVGSPALARPTVSVPEFRNTVNQSWWWSGPVADDLSAALANELQAAGGLQVGERSNLKAVLSEQAKPTDYVAIDVRVVDSTTGEVVGFRTVEGTATSTAESRQQGVNLLPAAGLTIFGVPMSRGGQALVGAAGTFRYDKSSSETQRTPVGKALRAALVDASDYVSCLLAPQGNCMERFEAQDQRRRQRTRSVLDLD
jgi:curli biogenesis system outer membrane secretion channel CsgG